MNAIKKILKRACLGEVIIGNPSYGAPASSVLYVQGVTPRYVRITDITEDGFLKREGKVGIPAELAKGNFLEDGDIVIARTGASVGKSLLFRSNGEPAAFAGYLIRFRPDPTKCDGDYLRQCLHSDRYWSWVRQTIRAGAQPNINSAEFASFTIPLPNLPEQRQLSAMLGAWDKAFEKLQSLVISKRDQLNGLRQYVLSGKRRFPEYKSKAWLTKKIGDILKPVNRYEDWNETRSFKLAGVRRNSGGVFFRDELLGTEIKVKVCKKIHTGDFLISRRQITWGGMSIVPPEFHGYDVNDEYEVLQVRDAAMFDMRFFHYLSQTAILKNLAYLASNGVFAERLRLNFDLKTFLKQPIRIPPTKAEQLKIISLLDGCVREINLLEAELDALKLQKRGLMQKLLTGEKRVKT